MAFIFANPNPSCNLTGDCVIRAVSILTDQDWEKTYLDICIQGLLMHDMPSSNSVWSAYLHDKGFDKGIIPDMCPECYTIREFAHDNPNGKYLVATGTHVVSIIDGNYYDTWDSGDEIPIFYWHKES